MKRGLLASAIAVGIAGAVYAQIAGGEISYEQASVLAGSCFNCHGPEGVSPGPIPSIAGLPAAVTIQFFTAFKADEVPGATIMRRIALGYSDAQIAALARYFAGWNGGPTP